MTKVHVIILPVMYIKWHCSTVIVEVTPDDDPMRLKHVTNNNNKKSKQFMLRWWKRLNKVEHATRRNKKLFHYIDWYIKLTYAILHSHAN
jgi:hypothetical protein